MVYFVTEEFIKNKTHITQNVDAGDIAPYLQIASETNVQNILGFNFYNDILTKFNDNNLSPDEEVLVEFIRYVVAFYAAYEAAPNLTFRISNKGIQSQFGEYSAQESIQVLDYIRRNILKFALIKEDNLRSYLNENKDKFPEWTAIDNESVQSPDTRRSNNSGGVTAI